MTSTLDRRNSLTQTIRPNVRVASSEPLFLFPLWSRCARSRLNSLTYIFFCSLYAGLACWCRVICSTARLFGCIRFSLVNVHLFESICVCVSFFVCKCARAQVFIYIVYKYKVLSSRQVYFTTNIGYLYTVRIESDSSQVFSLVCNVDPMIAKAGSAMRFGISIWSTFARGVFAVGI